jgi:hypothetical protein
MKDKDHVEFNLLDELSGYSPEITITRPDGKKLTFKVKAPTPDDIETIRKSVPTPTRKVIEITKDRSTGKMTPVYDEEKYQEDLVSVNLEYNYRIIAFALSGAGHAIPGADLKEQAIYVRSKFDSWAVVQLGKELGYISGMTEREVDDAFLALQNSME